MPAIATLTDCFATMPNLEFQISAWRANAGGRQQLLHGVYYMDVESRHVAHYTLLFN